MENMAQKSWFYVQASEVAFSELVEVVNQELKALEPFLGRYRLVVEFTEPNDDPRFVLGHQGAVITTYAQRVEDVEGMRVALGW